MSIHPGSVPATKSGALCFDLLCGTQETPKSAYKIPVERYAVISDKHHNVILEISALLLVLCAAFHLFAYVSADPDLWGHLKFGQAHWESGLLSKTDIYSFTAFGRKWINHEWLTELIFYLLFNTFKDAGLLFGKLFVGLAVVSVMLVTCRVRRSSPVITACVMMASVWAMKPGFMIRPQLFSFLFFSIYLLLFHLFFKRKINFLFCMPFIMGIWVNLHGGFLMGGALITVIVAWETIAHAIYKDRSQKLKQLWVWAVITAAAVLLNPYGYRLIVFLYKSLSLPREITEWMPVTLQDTSFFHFKIIGAAILVVLLFSGRRNQGWEVTVLIFTGFFALKHQRNIVFFGITAAPYLAAGITTMVHSAARRYGRLILSNSFQILIGIVFTVAAVWHAILGGNIYTRSGGGIVVDPNTYPVSAVEFLKQNRFQGNLFVFFDWGEYAIWKLYPDCKVSIDGRFRTVYPESVIRDHFTSADHVAKMIRVLAKYPADILLYPRTPFTASLMEEKKMWVYVYSDRLSLVFLRRNEKNRTLLSRFATSGFVYPIVADPFSFP